MFPNVLNCHCHALTAHALAREPNVNVVFKTKTEGFVQHLVIDFMGLKAYDKGEWTIKKYGTDGKR
ncbi:hypothetical protein [Candidatus Enterovibrio altilux]|uniref:Mobile element protein n=1 Tax=Candidatus Enterovibrio altilux TaxID=1927128 RepID=A0A291B7J7_9GAMM|nr:Mobile element protein [Candidatus Enterovibrio luxaltus]